MFKRELSFIATPFLFRSAKSAVIYGRCPCQRLMPPSRQIAQTRQTIVARVRRGQKPNPEIPETLYDADPIPDIDFKPFDFSTLRGKVVLIVNVASEDDYTDQNYKSFADLLEKYQEDGFEIIAFPSNWYGQFETGSFEEIKNFVHSKYTDRIKLMAKTDLEWNQAFALGRKYFPGEVIWNFHGKFLFGRKGLPVARFDLLTTHDYLEAELRRYISSSDPGIHDTVPPDPDTLSDDDDEVIFFSQNQQRKGKNEEVIDDPDDADVEPDEDDEDDVDDENDADDEDSVDAEEQTDDDNIVDADVAADIQDDVDTDIEADSDPSVADGDAAKKLSEGPVQA